MPIDRSPSIELPELFQLFLLVCLKNILPNPIGLCYSEQGLVMTAKRNASSVVEHSAFNRLVPSSTLGRSIN
jgi:hypothetical protein